MNKKFIYESHPHLFLAIGGTAAILQVVLAIIFYRGTYSSIVNLGWVILWTAGFFGVIPIITFRQKGGVPKSESYMNTTVLVDSGVYSIVRHPQNGVAWVLINAGIMLIAQHWIVVGAGVISIVFGYLDLYKEEQRCIEKFGENYREYMEKVPRINVLQGIFRAIHRR
ncbi:MAG: isoprenylcysteine carboxylmethyltransferase family protein [Candidatus Methanofastidiosia archaeon]|jgi:protein-S-isoprenylcysteine O-methyltransferase Ste14